MPEPTASTIATAAKAVSAISKFQPWKTVRRHDRVVREEYEDLVTWARDDLQKEASALEAVDEETNARNLFYSGYRGKELRRVRDEFAVRWRDRKRASDRKLEALREEEGPGVKAWRRLKKKPWLENPYAEELRVITRAWEDEAVRREAVERELAPQKRAAQEKAVWFFPEEKIWDVDQAAAYRGQIGNRGADEALRVTAQMVAETGEPLADAVEVGKLAAGASTQREFKVERPHPRLFCMLSWRNESGEEFGYRTGQVFPANPIA
jgi:hypothetical protein